MCKLRIKKNIPCCTRYAVYVETADDECRSENDTQIMEYYYF